MLTLDIVHGHQSVQGHSEFITILHTLIRKWIPH